MKQHSQNRKRKSILPFVLLAIVCIGSAELLACRHFEPQLYDQICAPARSAWRSATRLAVQAGNTLSDWTVQLGTTLSGWTESLGETLSELTQDKEDPEEPSQALGSGEGLSDPATALATQDGDQLLTGGSIDIIYYNQADPTWASGLYGSDSIEKYGCGPTAMAIVVSSLTTQRVTPVEMAQWAVDNHHWASHSGSYLSIVQGAATAFGLNAQAFPVDNADSLRLQLSSGHILVALMSAGHFTDTGHFIVLRGITQDGQILVADPSSSERSLTTWDAQLILDELSRSRNDGAPLWLITVPEKTP